MKYCHNCGAPLKESDSFCSKCGIPLRAELSSVPHLRPSENKTNVFSESVEALRTLLRLIYDFIGALNLKGWVCWFVICIIEVIILSQMNLYSFLSNYNNNVIIITGFATIFGGYLYNFVRWIWKKK